MAERISSGLLCAEERSMKVILSATVKSWWKCKTKAQCLIIQICTLLPTKIFIGDEYPIYRWKQGMEFVKWNTKRFKSERHFSDGKHFVCRFELNRFTLSIFIHQIKLATSQLCRKSKIRTIYNEFVINNTLFHHDHGHIIEWNGFKALPVDNNL